jgi:hypothetical protein
LPECFLCWEGHNDIDIYGHYEDTDTGEHYQESESKAPLKSVEADREIPF